MITGTNKNRYHLHQTVLFFIHDPVLDPGGRSCEGGRLMAALLTNGVGSSQLLLRIAMHPDLDRNLLNSEVTNLGSA